ncbi:MAG: DUF58 domain-containing protein [Sedimentisphaerales bacterium]|nr:DUF58 domain-containing protein [Sedimentisphaerales bacterium]
MKTKPESTRKSSSSVSIAPCLTDAGRILLGMTVGSGAICLFLPIFGVWTTCLLLFVTSLMIALIFRPHITITGRLPHRAVAGQTLTVRYTLTNHGRFSAFDLALRWIDLPMEIEYLDTARFLPCIRPGQSVEMKVRLHPTRRGQYQFFAPSCISTFPFHLFCSRGSAMARESLLVVPDFRPLESLGVSIARRYHRGGFLPAGRTGESPEYVGNRPFRPGDEPRKIDPRAWARLSTPVVKEYHEEYFGNVAIVLDTNVIFPGKTQPISQSNHAFEAAVSLTAAVAQNLSSHDNIVNVLTAGDKVYDLMVGRHINQFDRILEVLAGVELSLYAGFDSLPPALVDELANTSTVVYILLYWEPSRQQFIQQIAQKGCRSIVFVVNSHLPDISPADHRWIDVLQRIPAEQIQFIREQQP